MFTPLESLAHSIHSCNVCPRLREHCQAVAEVKRKAFQSEPYWGKPVSGFGDPQARLVIVGLAPAAHGANRTGRIFTGDRSGEWLYRALWKAGFANQPHSHHSNDGLILKDVYITCVVKCAPPQNKPLPSEKESCTGYLKEELKLFPQMKVAIALGQFAYEAFWSLVEPKTRKRPPFHHNALIPLSSGQKLILSFHPSQQNTFTGKLTEPMWDAVFNQALQML